MPQPPPFAPLPPKVKTVAVLMGGWSSERDVSLVSGRACAAGLRNRGYEVREIDVTRDLEKLIRDLTPAPEVVFNALHGIGGEDGCIQSVLDILGLPYTHSGRLASALAMDKQRSKHIVAAEGVRTAEGHIVSAAAIRAFDLPLPPPFVLKPNQEGSSVGVYIIREADKNLADIFDNWHFGDMLIEAYVPGRELTVAVMGQDDRDAKAMTVTEIAPKTAFYDYEAKYAAGGSDHILPAPVPKVVFDLARDWAVKAHLALGCRGVTRSDFRYDDSLDGTEGLYYLETNTQPGMTPTSLVPEQAALCGISFGALVRWMVEDASCSR